VRNEKRGEIRARHFFLITKMYGSICIIPHCVVLVYPIRALSACAMGKLDEAIPEFECWEVLVDHGPKLGNVPICLSHFVKNGPKFMIIKQVRSNMGAGRGFASSLVGKGLPRKTK
jgi:hypothetical protein